VASRRTRTTIGPVVIVLKNPIAAALPSVGGY